MNDVEIKIKNQPDLLKLYSFNEYQKSFTSRVTFKEDIDKALVGKPADYITVHLIVMQIIMEKFNSHSIGICLSEDIENRMRKQIEIKNKILYEN